MNTANKRQRLADNRRLREQSGQTNTLSRWVLLSQKQEGGCVDGPGIYWIDLSSPIDQAEYPCIRKAFLEPEFQSSSEDPVHEKIELVSSENNYRWPRIETLIDQNRIHKGFLKDISAELSKFCYEEVGDHDIVSDKCASGPIQVVASISYGGDY